MNDAGILSLLTIGQGGDTSQWIYYVNVLNLSALVRHHFSCTCPSSLSLHLSFVNLFFFICSSLLGLNLSFITLSILLLYYLSTLSHHHFIYTCPSNLSTLTHTLDLIIIQLIICTWLQNSSLKYYIQSLRLFWITEKFTIYIKEFVKSIFLHRKCKK